MASLVKCSVCGREVSSGCTSCPNCGHNVAIELQKNKFMTFWDKIKNGDETKIRHSFVTFWLWAMVVWYCIQTISCLIAKDANIPFFTFSIWQMFSYACCAISAFLLLGWKKIGFWGYCISMFFVMIFSFGISKYAPNTDAKIMSIMLNITKSALLPFILYAILQIKKNEKSCWKQLE